MTSPRPTPPRASTPSKREHVSPAQSDADMHILPWKRLMSLHFYHGNDDDLYLLLAMGPFSFFFFYHFLFLKRNGAGHLISMETGHGSAHLRPQLMMHPRRHICFQAAGQSVLLYNI